MNKFTIAFWFKADSAPFGANGLVCKRYGFGNQTSYAFFLWGTNLYIDVDYENERFASVTNFEANKWYHIAVVFDGSWPASQRVRLYVNGALDRTAPESATSIPDNEVSTLYDRQATLYQGSFVSRIMDSFSSLSWSTLNFKTPLPYGKELPNNGVSETTASYSQLFSSTLMNLNYGLWHFNESSGSVNDNSPMGNHGTVTGTVTRGSAGKFSNAALFSGAGQISVPSSFYYQAASTDSYTLSAWIKVSNLSPAQAQGIITMGTDGGVWLTMAGEIQLKGPTSTLTGPVINTGWQHLVITQVGGTSRTMYLNGTQVATDGNPQTYDNTKTLVFGGTLTGDYFDGYIDEVSVWGRVLSNTEISQLRSRGNPPVKFQVRTCSTSNCADDVAGANWKGPDATSSTYFSEVNNSSASSPSFTISPSLTTQYIQYRAYMESKDTAASDISGISIVDLGPTHYASEGVGIIPVGGLTYGNITSFIETLGAGGCAGSVRYLFSRDKTTWYYVNGSNNWVASDGTYSQASLATTINAQASTFAGQVGTGTLYVQALLKSNGSTVCELDNLDIGIGN